MHDLTFQELMSVSVVLPVLLVLSIMCIMVMFERLLFFLRNARINGRVVDRVRTCLPVR